MLRRLITVLLVPFLVALIPHPVLACSYDENAIPTTAEQVASADVVFKGVIIRTEGDSEAPHTAIVLVDAYYKTPGDTPFTVTVTGFGGGADCTPYAQAGEQQIFYAKGAPSGTLTVANLFDTAPPDAGLQDEIQSLTGTAPVPPTRSDQQLAPEIFRSTPMRIILGLLVLVIVLLVIVQIRIRRAGSV
jgi:hypothetical protein